MELGQVAHCKRYRSCVTLVRSHLDWKGETREDPSGGVSVTKKIAMMIALAICMALGLASTSSANDLDDRKEVREAAGVEAGDRVDRRQEVRESAEVDVDDRKEAREEAGVEAGDRVDRRKEVRESTD